MLGGAVDAHLRRRTQAGHRRRVDNGAATLGQQQRQLVLHAQPDALDVHAHDGIELRFTALGQSPLLDLDTGVVVGIIEPPVGGDDLLVQLAHIGLAGHVAGDEQRLAAGVTNQPDGGLAADRIEIGHHHLQALTGKGQRRRPADTGRATGDQGYLAGKGHAHHSLLKIAGQLSGQSLVRRSRAWAASSRQRLVYHA
ncbi:hypothetical protein D3C81_625650 [compost metagenome]